MRRRFRLLAVAGLAFVATGSTSSAQNWYETIFPERSKDLGTVARGSKIRHTFKLVNTTSYDVHIQEYRTKCGCTEVKLGSKDIPPGTQTTIEATIDTTRFQGYKPSGLTLILTQPSWAEVDLNLSCFIRGDVTLNPGAVDFQVVPRGQKASNVAQLTYAGGNAAWKITGARTISENVKAEVTELGRNGGMVQYQVSTTLAPTAPAGNFKDEITLLTNDPSSPAIPISVSGTIQAGVAVSPGTVNFHHLKAGETRTTEVLVRSSKPFSVTGMKAQKAELTATSGTTPLSLQRVTLTLKAPATPGPFHSTLEIATDMKDEPPAKLTAFAVVDP